MNEVQGKAPRGIGALARSVACSRAAGRTCACRPRACRRARCSVREETGRGVRCVARDGCAARAVWAQ